VIAPPTHTQQGDAHAPRPAPPEKTPSGIQWPVMIVGLLGLNIVVCAITITAATTNPAIIEPDYYEKAVNWDEHRGIATPTPGDTKTTTEARD
jgi:predicted cobalt transporter CbtA